MAVEIPLELREQSSRYCCIIASHIISAEQIKNLIGRCLNSMREQHIPIMTYLSISFKSPMFATMFKRMIVKYKFRNWDHLFIVMRPNQHSQFGHIKFIVDGIWDKHQYIMFCNDQDKYDIARTTMMINYTNIIGIPDTQKFVGAYEQIGKYTNKTRFHDYWQYCCDIIYVRQFFARLVSFDHKYIDHGNCDLLFAVYLRQLGPGHSYTKVPHLMYKKFRTTMSYLDAKPNVSDYDEVLRNIFSQIVLDNGDMHGSCSEILSLCSAEHKKECVQYYAEIKELCNYMLDTTS